MKTFLAVAAMLSLSALARDHTALNGTWTLAPVTNELAGQSVTQSGSVTINEREGNISVARDFVYKNATETFSYQDSADSRNNATIRSGKDLKTKAKWDGDVLTVTTTQSGMMTIERYSLNADGTMKLDVERPGHGPLTLIFERRARP